LREIYRILDANFNRAREALRVIEDFARFALDDAGLSASAKGLRARLRRARERFPAGELLAARDTPGDVGTRITTAEEKDRPDAAAVVSAACKRLGEALRTLEEYAKVVSAEDASAFEEMRYSAYALEQRLGARLAVGRRFEDVRLYVLLTSRLCRRDPLLVARAVLAGGAECIQVREKDMPDRQLLGLIRRLREITLAAGALLIVNDRPDLAALGDADGLHLGQDDLPVPECRRLLRPGAIIGRSTHDLDQARAAEREGADYIGVGPMFASTTKPGEPVAGVGFLRQVLGEVSLPHVAIGGITAENVGELVAAGARRVAVCAAVISAEDPEAQARRIRSRLPS